VTREPGSGLLEITRAARRSVVRRAFATSPLRLLTPRSHGGAAWVYAASYGGGLLDADCLKLALAVGPGARAFLSTQASTKVYRSPSGASVELDARIESAGLLVLWPDPVVCFAGSRYRQRQELELASDAALVLVDWMTSGRRAYGERWQFHDYSSRLTVRHAGDLILRDALTLAPEDGNLAVRMGRFDVLATAVVIGRRFESIVHSLLDETSRLPVERVPECLQSAAPIGGAGCIVRIVGRSVETVGAVLRRTLSFVPSLLGDDPWSRKW
jgi:urease accessory protein